MEKAIEVIKKNKKIKAFGNSMQSILHDGDVVYFKKINFSHIKVNDVICFKRRSVIVTHRVIYKKKSYVVTKGDNNPISDGKVMPDNILGRVVSAKRDGQIFNIDDIYLFQSSIYFEEIKKIVRILNEERIDFVILKGLPVHLFLEKKHPRRLYADCDILVAKKDALRVIKLFKKENYGPLDFSLSEKHKTLRDKVVEESYGKTINGLPVVFDIHYEAAFMMTQLGSLNFLYPQKLLMGFTKALLDNKKNVQIEGIPFPLLSLEDQILYLFLHLFHHNFRGTYRYDILVKILDSKFDAYQLAKIVTEYQLTNFVYAGLMLLQKYYPNENYRKLLGLLTVSKTVEKYVVINVLLAKIFDDEDRVGGGVRRFLLLFYLSPRPILLRLMVCLNRQVLYSIYWVFINKSRQIILQNFPFSRGLLQLKSL